MTVGVDEPGDEVTTARHCPRVVQRFAGQCSRIVTPQITGYSVGQHGALQVQCHLSFGSFSFEGSNPGGSSSMLPPSWERSGIPLPGGICGMPSGIFCWPLPPPLEFLPFLFLPLAFFVAFLVAPPPPPRPKRPAICCIIFFASKKRFTKSL